MSEFTTIMARDGHEFRAWLAPPAGRPRGAIVVVQEIFGVNSHIRSVTDGYAKEGYVAIAPCLFDRVRRGIELGYSAAEMQEGLAPRFLGSQPGADAVVGMERDVRFEFGREVVIRTAAVE